PQHLSGLKLVRDICGGRLENAAIGSTEVTFYPGPIRGGEFTADTGTAGSVVLLLQVALPCLLFANGPSTLWLRGGTNAEMAPQIDYTLSVFQPALQKFGAAVDIRVLRRGYFPKGGGQIEVHVEPVTALKPVELVEPGRVVKVTGRSFVAGMLPPKLSFPPRVMAKSSTGCCRAGSSLGKRGSPAEAVGEAAARDLLRELERDTCVDSYLQDQLPHTTISPMKRLTG
ncbi:hypothetical protein HPB47_018380, partial [Ixodes persulcatus]